MLHPPELALLIVTALGVTIATTALTLLVLRLVWGRSLALRLAVIQAGSVVSIIGASTVAAAEAFLSGTDLVVLGLVIGVSAITSLVTASSIARIAIRRSTRALITTTRRIGAGEVVGTADTGWKELDVVADELALTSHRLAASRIRVAELDAGRRQLFAWIAHDLRTPLAGMSAMLEALDERSAADPVAYMRLLRGRVDSMTRLVDDLFRLSVLQSDSLVLRPERLALRDLISDIVADVRPVAEAEGVHICDDGVDGQLVWADPAELARAVENLLTNAIRHAPPDSTILIRAGDTAGHRTVISVIDRGPGVPDDDLGRMFEMGWRADPHRTAGVSTAHSTGAGLGLAIVKSIMEAHGGTAVARFSEAGFHVDLILPSCTPAAASSAAR